MNKRPVLELISDEMRAVVAKSDELYAATPAGDTLAEQRAAYLYERVFWNEGGAEPAEVIDGSFQSRHGEVAVRRYIPTRDTGGAAPLAPAIIYLHGGGFVLGNLDTHDRIMRVLACTTGAVVVGLDYTLSPEAKFPVALEQCVDLALSLHEMGAEWGIDPAMLSFAGDSCGAYLSLASFLYLRDECGGAGFIRTLLLYYGLYGLRDSMARRLLGGPWDGLTEEDLSYYYGCYLADDEDRESPYVDCLRADFTRGMPPCYIASAEYDPLKDDSATLSALLAEAGVPFVHTEFSGVLHAFLHNSRLLTAAREALAEGSKFFRAHVQG